MVETIIDKRRRRSGKKKFPILFIVICIIVVVSLFKKQPPILKPIPDHPSNQKNILGLFKKQPPNPEDLRTIVSKSADTVWNNYSILVSDLNSGFRMGINESVIYTGASVNKVAILAGLYAAKSVDFDRVITLQAADIQDYGTGSIRYDPPGSTYTVKTLAMLMIKQSDNTAAHILANYVLNPDSTNTLLKTWGLIQTDMEQNKTSNADMEHLFIKIYRNEITDSAHTKELLGMMTGSDFENRLPAKLPKTVSVYHKIGSETGFIHDVGIVTDGNTAYYIGIFTSDIRDEKKTESTIAEISKQVYEFMEKLQD